MGSGGGKSVSTQSAEFPPEFRPLAEAAVNQLLALGEALPITDFVDPHPLQVAGLTPLQQLTIEATPGLLQPTQGLRGLLGLTTPLAQLTQQALNSQVPSQATQTALASLAPRLGGPTALESSISPSLDFGGIPTGIDSLLPGVNTNVQDFVQAAQAGASALPPANARSGPAPSDIRDLQSQIDALSADVSAFNFGAPEGFLPVFQQVSTLPTLQDNPFRPGQQVVEQAGTSLGQVVVLPDGTIVSPSVFSPPSPFSAIGASPPVIFGNANA